MPERDTIQEYPEVFLNYVLNMRADAQERGF